MHRAYDWLEADTLDRYGSREGSRGGFGSREGHKRGTITWQDLAKAIVNDQIQGLYINTGVLAVLTSIAALMAFTHNNRMRVIE